MSTNAVTRHEVTRCKEGSCIKAELIEALDHVVNGNGQPGLVHNLSELKTEFREFVSYSKGRDEARERAEQEKEKEDLRKEQARSHIQWALGLLFTLFIGLLLWLLNVLATPPLKEKGIISHSTESYSRNMISTK